MYHLGDTICAIASAPGGAGRGIVRVSGPAALDVVASCFRSRSQARPANVTRPTVLDGVILLPPTAAGDAADLLPADLYLWPTARTYTREPVAEIHTLGSPPLLATVLATLCAAGARAAEPGEFTLRAFLSGRLDLTQAEAVLGIIDAEGRRQFDVALKQMAGGLSRPMQALRESLVDLLAELEAGLDFVDEDIEFISQAQLHARLSEAANTVAALVEQMSARGDVADTLRAVLVGWPNVGKSSLFNCLTGGASAALVSEQPGTTRDYLVAWLDESDPAAARRCQLVDTAGFEPEASAVGPGRLAQQTTAEQATSADVLVLCLDSTRPPNAWEQEQLASQSPQPRLIALTKCDAPRQLDRVTISKFAPAVAIVETSAQSGLGLDELRQAICRLVLSQATGEMSAVAATATRSRESLRLAAEALARAVMANTDQLGEELVAAEVRAALAELGKVVGAVYTDDILDRIFSRFCIGK